MQGLSVSTLTASGNAGVYGSTALWGRHFQLMRKSHIPSGRERDFLWHHCAQKLFFTGQLVSQIQRNFRVEAGWLFKGGNQGLDASSERSESANEDILIFFFQLDLATRVQCALNMEQYEIAQQLRDKLTEVEAEVTKHRETKTGFTSKTVAQDNALSMIRLRANLEKAIEAENYAWAAELRDEINKLEAESLAASANALVYEKIQYAFRLGQRVKHKLFGYSGVICGMDPVCCESNSWRESAHVDKLTRGSYQPFYQVLVDVHVDPDILVAYVAEENLQAPEGPKQVRGYTKMGRFDHPYLSFLFYGMDAAGDFIPIKQLREKYNRPRHEVPTDPPEEDEDDG